MKLCTYTLYDMLNRLEFVGGPMKHPVDRPYFLVNYEVLLNSWSYIYEILHVLFSNILN